MYRALASGWRRPPARLAHPREPRLQVGDEVVGVFEADVEAQDGAFVGPVGDAAVVGHVAGQHQALVLGLTAAAQEASSDLRHQVALAQRFAGEHQ